MKKLLLLSVSLLALAVVPAKADIINVTATVDALLPFTASSLTGIYNNSGALPFFTFNSLLVTSQSVLGGVGILSTNTLDLSATDNGSHTLVLDIIASDLTGTNSLQNLLSSFSVTALAPGWSVREQTFINGSLIPLADTGVLSGTVASSAFSINPAFLTNPFSAEARYTIVTNGIGRFNGGIDIAGVPGPIVGGGLPGLAAFGMFLLGAYRRRRAAI